MATRTDGVILKPAFAALRIDAFYRAGGPCQGKEVWTAGTLPASAHDHGPHARANSMARTDSADGMGSETGVWWYSVLATDVGTPSCAITPADLWPRSAAGTAFMASATSSPRCLEGAPAASCLVPFGAAAPLAFNTSNHDPKGRPERTWSLASLAPVLPGGWVLVGEQSKYVGVSPQRFASTRAAAQAGGASDAFHAAEMVGGSGGCLAFDVVGAEGEAVEVAVVVPAKAAAGARAMTDVERAGQGTVDVVAVKLGAAAVARIVCDATGCGAGGGRTCQ